MKRLLLNCDQVFDVLTRGPFPTGEPEDVAVEQHLRACHDCRQLAEALRPAISLLHEAVTSEEAIDLPEYQGSLPWKRPKQHRRLSIARLAARREASQSGEPAQALQVATRGEPRQPQLLSAARLIAAALLLAALGALVGGAILPGGARRQFVQVTSDLFSEQAKIHVTPDGVPSDVGLLTLASLKLPASCVPLTHQPLSPEHATQIAAALADGSFGSLRCCTECHHAGQQPISKVSLAAITQQSCQACHRG